MAVVADGGMGDWCVWRREVGLLGQALPDSVLARLRSEGRLGTEAER